MAASMTKDLRLGDLLAGIVSLRGDFAAIEVHGLTMDSREVRPGDCFLACAGASTHGAAFIAQAFGAGARVALLETQSHRLEMNAFGGPVIPVLGLRAHAGLLAHRFFAEPSRDLAVIGVTGTNGKTSVSHFIAQALGEDPPRGPSGLIGTLGHGTWGRLTPQRMTTPDPITVHSLLAGMREKGMRSVAMEVSSHALVQGRVNAVAFDTAVFTNLSRDHLDYHGDMQGYGEAKKRLFRMPGLRHAVINLDDPFAEDLLAALAGEVSVIGYTLGMGKAKATQTLRARVTEASKKGIRVQLDYESTEGVITSPLLGRINAQNLLAALGALLATGTPFARAVEDVSRVTAVPGRLEVFPAAPTAPTVIVDYAHTPHALEEVLSSLRPLCAERLWCVFGCGGDRDKGKRPQMGEIAERFADVIVLTDDNPRSEDPDAIIRAILSGTDDRSRVRVVRDRACAIHQAISAAGAQDLVLIAGKGHETYQEIAEIRTPFSDRQFVRDLLGEGRA